MFDHSFLIILFLSSISLLSASPAFLSAHEDLPVFTKNLKESAFIGKTCKCSRQVKLANMAPVRFDNGHTYMVDAKPFGQGGYGRVYHAFRFMHAIKQPWLPYIWEKCVAIKIANVVKKETPKEVLDIMKKGTFPPNFSPDAASALKNRMNENREYRKSTTALLEKEIRVLQQLWKPKRALINAYGISAMPKHIIRFVAKEQFNVVEIDKSQLPSSSATPSKSIEKAADDSGKTSVLVMEIGIKTLSKYWKEIGRLHAAPIDEIAFLKILRQIALALQEFHERGFIYMDLKPENIILTKEPKKNIETKEPKKNIELAVENIELKLIDIGGTLAYDAGALTTHSSPKQNSQVMVKMGHGVFTRYYAAPEVINDRRASPLSDVYSFGRFALKMMASLPFFKSYIADNQLNEKMNFNSDNILPGVTLLQHLLNAALLQKPTELEEFVDTLKNSYPHIFGIIMETQKDHAQRPNAKNLIQQIDKAIAVFQQSDKAIGHRHSMFGSFKTFAVKIRSKTETRKTGTTNDQINRKVAGSHDYEAYGKNLTPLRSPLTDEHFNWQSYLSEDDHSQAFYEEHPQIDEPAASASASPFAQKGMSSDSDDGEIRVVKSHDQN